MDDGSGAAFYPLNLKKSQQAILQQIFSSSFTQDLISLFDFMFFYLKRSIVSNTCTFHTLLTIFKQVVGDKQCLTKKRFYASVCLLARVLFPDDFNPIERMLTDILNQSTQTSLSHLPAQDLGTTVLLTQGAIKQYEGCQDGFLTILMLYNTRNIQHRRKVVGQKMIKQTNTGITARSFLRYCRAAKIIPHLVNIQTLQECIQLNIPAVAKQQKDFYDNHFLVRAYQQDTHFKKMIPQDPVSGEPQIKLYHLQLILGRVAILGLSELDDPILQLHTLLYQKLRLGEGMDYGPGCQITYDTDYLSDASFSSIEDQDQILAEYQRKMKVSSKSIKDDRDLSEVVKNLPDIPTIKQVSKMMDQDRIPQIPQPPVVQPVNPPPYTMKPIQFPLPKPSQDDAKKAGIQKQEKQVKFQSAGQHLKFVVKPGAMPKIVQKSRDELFYDLRTNLQKNLNSQTIKSMLSNPGIQPCLIREVLTLPQAPPHINTLLQSAFVYQHNGNYSMAIHTLDQAKSQWLSLQKLDQLKPEQEIFFQYSKASIFQSCGKDQLALAFFFNLKQISDRLLYNHPDKALVYCGLGSALFHLDFFQESLRAFLAAKKIRERVIGGDTVDTATVYNNAGVCLVFLDRIQEAMAYFELSEAILMMILGSNHPRTMTARQNIEKTRRESFIQTPEYQPLWKQQFVDPYAKGKKKGKKKKKKGKK